MIRTFLAATAIAAATAVAAPPAAQATSEQTKIIYSETWQPGFRKGDDHRYYKITTVEEDFKSQVLHYETSSTPQDGFRKSDDGALYYRLVEVPMQQSSQELRIVKSDTWKPGYLLGDDGTYVKLMHVQK